MTDEKREDKESVDLYLHMDKKVEKAKTDIEELFKKDLGLDHKMDLVIKAQDNLQNRFNHSSETGHKTWEAVQKMTSSMEKMAGKVDSQIERIGGTLDSHKQRIEATEKLAEKIDSRFDKFFMATLITACVALLATVMSFLWHYRP